MCSDAGCDCAQDEADELDAFADFMPPLKDFAEGGNDFSGRIDDDLLASLLDSYSAPLDRACDSVLAAVDEVRPSDSQQDLNGRTDVDDFPPPPSPRELAVRRPRKTGARLPDAFVKV